MASLLTDIEKKFMESQTETLKIQTKILEKQTRFTKILALGTLVLAFTSFLQVYNVELSWNTGMIIFGIAILTTIFLIITMFYLLIIVTKFIKGELLENETQTKT